MHHPPTLALALLAAPLFLAAPARADEPPATAERGRVGFVALPVAAISAEKRAFAGITSESGVIVVRLVPGSPAEKAGLKLRDRLVKYAGKDLPDASAVKPEDDASIQAWLAEFGKVAGAVKAGEKVEIVVERDGKPTTLSATAVTEAEMKKLEPPEEDEGNEDKGGEVSTSKATLPTLASAGAPAATKVDFSGRAAGMALPEGFVPVSGTWKVVDEPGAPAANPVLKQEQPTQPWAVLLAAGKGRAYADGKASVRFQPVSGKEDASGGIVFRAQDATNYYVVRANALEDNFRLYVVKDGARRTLASADVRAPSLGAWHTIEVTFSGSRLKATLDGKDAVEAKDDSFASGWCGLWTKADSVTLFDDFAVEPASK